MALGRIEVVEGVAAELARFGDLIGVLDEHAWATPSRCVGWTVADIAGHVVGGLADIAAGRLSGLGDPDAPQRRADERRSRSVEGIRAELEAVLPPVVAGLRALDEEAWEAPAPGELAGGVGSAVEMLWYETYVHGDDIRDALGLASERGLGLRAAVWHVAGVLGRQGWGPATLELDGMEPVPIGEGGPTLHGDPLTFVLVASGRGHPLELGLTQPLNIHAPGSPAP